MSSVGNQWCLKQLQQAALLQERFLLKGGKEARSGWRGGGAAQGPWSKNSVHMTALTEGDEDSDAEAEGDRESDSELVPASYRIHRLPAGQGQVQGRLARSSC